LLKRFDATNFKSLVRTEFAPVGLNLLVGDNNAGKTNLCQALRFVALSATESLDYAAAQCTSEPWNLFNVYQKSSVAEFRVLANVDSEGETYQFDYQLQVSGRKSERLISKPLQLEYECLRVTSAGFESVILLENRAGEVRLLHERRFVLGPNQLAAPLSNKGTADPNYVETSASTESTMISRLYDLNTNKRANLFKRFISAWTYYNFDPERLRKNLASPMERSLKADGSNLSSVVFTLHNEKPRDFRKLLESVKLLEPRLDLISFQTPDPEHVYMFFEDQQGHKFGTNSVSDGTLRFLAMCYLLISNRQPQSPRGSTEAARTVPLVIIEEPENGVYVGHLKDLFEKIEPSGVDGQFVFTSHNPYFIDLFDSHLEGIHLVKNRGDYSEVVKPDSEKLSNLLETFSVGEMHFRGLLHQ
jgi:predicted ATPase